MNKIIIKIIDPDISNILKKINNYRISFIKIKYLNNNEIWLTMSYHDYEKFITYLPYLTVSIIKIGGITGIIRLLCQKMIPLICLGLFFIIYILSTKLIVKVEVLSNDLAFVESLKYELAESGIEVFKWQKNFEEIGAIKAKIMANHKEDIEWLEIRRVGMIYYIDVVRRIVKPEKTIKNLCHIVATKEGIIRQVIYDKGQLVVERNDIVAKDDLLISGNIYQNENIVNTVCASGNVYAEVWYTVDISIPKVMTNNIKTNNWRYGLFIKSPHNEVSVLHRRFLNSTYELKQEFSIFNYGFSIYKEYELVQTKEEINENKALELANNMVKEKLGIKLGKNEYIIHQNVLKKEVNDSTIDLRVFVIVNENIAKLIEE